jgi:lipoate-protein ligase B
VNSLIVQDLGRRSYADALDRQLRLVEGARKPGFTPHLLLVEHDPPVITLGRRARDEHLLVGPDRLAELGVEVHRVQRGGDVTYHGPGQLVAYPILRVDRVGRDVHKYLRDIEQAIIDTLAALGIAGRRREGFTGVWVRPAHGAEPEKVAAIGVGLKRWVSFHGLALNVCCELSHFDLIVPCGIADRAVTSVSKLLDEAVGISRVKPILVQSLAKVFGFEDVRHEPPDDAPPPASRETPT